MANITELAEQQLDAYNARDLDRFVDCYHPNVQVWDGAEQVCHGLVAFRARYRALFEGFEFGAEVPERIGGVRHCVDLEHWWRLSLATGERESGVILVHYTAKDDRIIEVRFLPAG